MVKTHSAEVAVRFVKMMKQVIALGLLDVHSKVDFADYIGIQHQNLAKIEAGDRYPTVEALCNACIHFQVDPSWLLLGTGEMFTTKKEEKLKLLRDLLDDL